jgi:hypothetical protein
MITRRQANVGILANAAAAATPRLAAAQEAQAITLPSPRNDGGEPLRSGQPKQARLDR